MNYMESEIDVLTLEVKTSTLLTSYILHMIRKASGYPAKSDSTRVALCGQRYFSVRKEKIQYKRWFSCANICSRGHFE